ncbi:MAG: DUF2281 domain-containing protein [Microcoleaceae cyanobacterium]
MTIKEELIQEIENISEAELIRVLEFVKTLRTDSGAESDTHLVWQAYLQSEQEREEVYRRLADS